MIGSGVFPTSGTANPTLTLSALALWAAETILGDLRAPVEVQAAGAAQVETEGGHP
jgi:choline dehydrogenase-like flavoprotein